MTVTIQPACAEALLRRLSDKASFGAGNDQGVGSAIGVILLLLVVPVMVFNIRRLRRAARR